MRTSKNKIIAMFCGAVALPYLVLAQPNAPAVNQPVTGDWVIHFEVGKQSVSGNLQLQAEGELLTGTVETAHTGPGKIQDGKWSSQKLKATCVFAKHENVILEGELKSDGTLAGKYSTEGRTEPWHAERKVGGSSRSRQDCNCYAVKERRACCLRKVHA